MFKFKGKNIAIGTIIPFPSGMGDHTVIECSIILKTSSTVGNRQLAIQILNASDAVQSTISASDIQAEDSNILYIFENGAADATVAGESVHTDVGAVFTVADGYKLKIVDSNNVDAASDVFDILIDTMD